MESTEDKLWASKYLLDPLTAPEPSQETGPGSHFASVNKMAKEPSVSSTETYPTPPTSASPTRTTFSTKNPYNSTHRQTAFTEHVHDGPSKPHNLNTPEDNGTGRRRGNSLGGRYPGDMSHRPLDVLKREAKTANRSPHLKKNHIPGADLIDSLDAAVVGRAYHHEGPYDPTLLARNTNYRNSPVAAVRGSNEEALRATPSAHIRDALDKHVPLQGTAVIPPGGVDVSGQEMRYSEGADLMREDGEGGAYKRWPGIKYHPDDLKGKGEPSYTVERALREHNNNTSSHRRIMSDGSSAYEMQSQSRPAASRQRSASGGNGRELGYGPNTTARRHDASESGMHRSNTTGGGVSGGLMRKFGSLRKSKKTTEV